MLHVRNALVVTLALVCGIGWSTAIAQTRSDFVAAFAGDWRTQSGNFTGSGDRCALFLNAGNESPLPLTNQGCGRELSPVTGWEIDNGQIVLFDGSGNELARMGGNQQRLNGDTASGNAIILERQDGNFAAGEPGCVYLGYTSTCAGLNDLSVPRVDGGAQINVLTKTNLREGASLSSDVLAIVPPNTCLAVDRCSARPDGAWCQARFENRTGWVKKRGSRLDEYPTVIFANQC